MSIENPDRENIAVYNRQAWNQQVTKSNRWTVPVTPDEIARAKEGDWSIVLTPDKSVPRDWFPDLNECQLLCLAGAGGQQAPILAAAGASVTVYDLSENQLGQDRLVAEREGLDIKTIQGDMRDLSAIADEQFDFIVHPCSNCFVPDINPVWREAFRVMKKGGELIAGFCNPFMFIFDDALMEQGELKVTHKLPFSDLDHPDTMKKYIDDGEPLCFSHSLEDQIGGQLRAGFLINAMFEDRWDAKSKDPLSEYLPTFVATKAIKLV